MEVWAVAAMFLWARLSVCELGGEGACVRLECPRPQELRQWLLP